MRIHCLLVSLLLLAGTWMAPSCLMADDDPAEIVKALEHLGVDCEFDDNGNVSAARFGFSLATAEDLLLLEKLLHIEELSLFSMKLGSDGFKQIGRLTKLKRLYASDTKCTDQDAKFFSALSDLEELDLEGTAVTDASVEVFAMLKKLRRIDLSQTRVTPVGLRRLRDAAPRLQVIQYWEYFAGFKGGRGVLDLDHAIIVFDYLQVPISAGSGGGGLIQVSGFTEEDQDFESGSSGGGTVNGIKLTASQSTNDGIPTIKVGKHIVEIKSDGGELVIDGQTFPITDKKLRIRVNGDGVATIDM